MSKVTIGISGYGVIVVKYPKKLTKQSYTDGVAEAVAKTCQLLDPITQKGRFHPVLGTGGYTNDQDL